MVGLLLESMQSQLGFSPQTRGEDYVPSSHLDTMMAHYPS